jgi:pantoate--beta-alanine ligase
MGALHTGHLKLVKESIKECDITVCSIYVNPTQFNNQVDLDKYPNTFESDTEMLREIGCDFIFCPSNNAMYPNGNQINFDFGSLDKVMEGEFRGGHFSGVGIVVSKLFNIVQPDFAYFGQKDLQQFAVIHKVVEELHFNTSLRCVPTVREESGLAMSSRNLRLSDQGRKDAVIIYESLTQAKEYLKKGTSISDVKNKIKHKFASSIVDLEYFEVVNGESLTIIDQVTDSPVAICIAGHVEGVRLIDNMLLNQ